MQRRGSLQTNDANNTAWPDIFVVEDFLDASLCERVAVEMSIAEARSSVVYGSSRSGVVDEASRRSLRLTPPVETAELIVSRLLATMPAIGEHFGVGLSECEEPQFLRYKEGDFFVAHQDGNTGLLRLDTERRRVSTVIFLSDPNVYSGGSLVFTNLRARPEDAKFRVHADPGTLIAFRSETTHEVTPVTHGERHTIVSWYR